MLCAPLVGGGCVGFLLVCQARSGPHTAVRGPVGLVLLVGVVGCGLVVG